jgi:hypothetical protein
VKVATLVLILANTFVVLGGLQVTPNIFEAPGIVKVSPVAASEMFALRRRMSPMTLSA